MLKEFSTSTVLSHGVESDLRTFRELIPFDSVTVTLAADDLQLVPDLATRLGALERDLSIDIRFATLRLTRQHHVVGAIQDCVSHVSRFRACATIFDLLRGSI